MTNVKERDDSDTDELITMTMINLQELKLMIVVLYYFISDEEKNYS